MVESSMNLKKLLPTARKMKQVIKPAAPVKFLDESSKRDLIDRYSQKEFAELDYALVRDFCDSSDHLPQICHLNGDLKNVQRAWTVKAVLGTLPLGSRLLEIGGGVPLAAGMLAELGYDVTIVDPYEGAGNGPTEYEAYKQQFPNVKFTRSYFSDDLQGYEDASFDGIYSISVLEHIPLVDLDSVYRGIHKFLRQGGRSIHCLDIVVEGDRTDAHKATLKKVFYLQKGLVQGPCSQSDTDHLCDEMLENMARDLETFYLSAEGHNLWRGSTLYEEFPFRKVISAQTCVSYHNN
ncbi:class I SAM-dependent methyltransferase [Leptolyngbya iicbica]|uniref:Class I SAM-dependent methyltransferase n=2 Tax=Cyanophyceae TaxID=3028117 RepID=A0A4Q7EHR6_9CYAN|nr:class I SAM-dependent methyltransferase [Leptolyngbya sp. LK]RZM82893.1 class I SAM-dependent methyltransferase [Leptolyngbya sp. LK]